MKNNILEVKEVYKSYKSYTTEWKRILSWFGFSVTACKENTTLKNINFTLVAGEALGIIGQNGAGKSTLLKIITSTLKASKGTVSIDGKIAAILELGMGFHPDLSGRQNAYHSAGLMGYTHNQIDEVIDEIADFAEIGDYFNQPVRLYSSGMQMRVAFSVATAFQPSILIIDEALSVGDAYFQHKCFEKIKKFQKEGTSLLFVSHDKGAILTLCDNVLLLEKGSVLKYGKPEEVTDYYNALIADKENSTISQKESDNGKKSTLSGTQEAIVIKNLLLNKDGKEVKYIEVGEEITLHVKVKVNNNLPSLVLGYMLKDRLGQDMFGTNTHHLKQVIENVNKEAVIYYNFKFNVNLGIGSYSITLALHADDTHLGKNYQWKDQALLFEVVNMSKNKFTGMTWMEPKLEYEYVSE